MITLHNSQRDLPLSLPEIKRAVSFLLTLLRIKTDEVILHFVTEKKICALHAEFFNDPTPTDCITFPFESSGPHKVLGEAFICPKVALSYARARDLSPYEELYRYIIHTLLHLIGFDDLTLKERQKMRRKETACLKKLLAFLA
ncbi:MAG: rRNA maturation RNase YbeY [Verrucomicrobia bacterium]|nr:rRNA maturation RNase YbeY [Verrucomicrobiota bacterium]